uniref:BHLH domain-containing protein n=1 Tax=Aegilops tauschii subsp. strangulata TaxID=200361 RepID=A0A453CAD2_AEGTS
MMMTQVANHSKRNHTDSYFSGKQQQQQQQAGATTTSGGSEEFAGMGSKKPRNASPRGSGGPISPKEKKDKVGERVAALQQLVSPFGKDGHSFCSSGGLGLHQVPAPAARGS